jgi:hypothetical protein
MEVAMARKDNRGKGKVTVTKASEPYIERDENHMQVFARLARVTNMHNPPNPRPGSR